MRERNPELLVEAELGAMVPRRDAVSLGEPLLTTLDDTRQVLYKVVGRRQKLWLFQQAEVGIGDVSYLINRGAMGFEQSPVTSTHRCRYHSVFISSPGNPLTVSFRHNFSADNALLG